MSEWNTIDGMLERLDLHMCVVDFNRDGLVFKYKIEKISKRDKKFFVCDHDLLKYLQRLERKRKIDRIKNGIQF